RMSSTAAPPAARKASSWASVGWPPVTTSASGWHTLGIAARASNGVGRGSGITSSSTIGLRIRPSNLEPIRPAPKADSMASPNFIIIGAQKSGTTWLARHLRNHPEVFLVRGEIHFFDKDFNFARGRDWYESQFAAATTHRAIGEKTPEYLWANGK